MNKKILQSYIEKLNLPKNQWVTIPFSALDPDDKFDLWEMYEVTYSAIGYKNYTSFKQLEDAGYELLKIIDVDDDPNPDAFIILRTHGSNKKINLMGSDGGKEAKRRLVQKFFELLNTPGYYMEASKRGGKLRDMIEANNISYVDDPQIIKDKDLIKKDFNWLDNGDGEYTRKLSGTGQEIIKKLFGIIR